MNTITFIAAGDIFITRRMPATGYEGFDKMRTFISRHDVKFANLETTFHEAEGTPSATSGGTWAMASPRCLDDINFYGFNLYTTANNHAADYGEGGVLATIRHMNERDMVFSGTGRNLSEASRACYLETEKARVALVSACATFHISDMAGGQSGEMTGRPGLNPLRFSTTYHVTERYFHMAKDLAKATSINDYYDYGVQLGFAPPRPEGTTGFGQYKFALDTENKVYSRPIESDMERIEKEIAEAKRQADIVMVSIHSHDTDGGDMTKPAGYLETFSKRCIDAGAQVVIGHGPHELRGIEIYNKGIIFYSLGNFIFESETVSVQPYEAYSSRNLPIDTKVGAFMDIRSKNGTKGYSTMKNIWSSVLAEWTVSNGNITQVQLHPISLGMEKPRSQRGKPILTSNSEVLKHLCKLCEPYGTKIAVKNNIGYINL